MRHLAGSLSFARGDTASLSPFDGAYVTKYFCHPTIRQTRTVPAIVCCRLRFSELPVECRHLPWRSGCGGEGERQTKEAVSWANSMLSGSALQ